jgi:TonB family protein
MGKIIKYCEVCAENFAGKFGFCPHCGTPLAALETKPPAGGAANGDYQLTIVGEKNVRQRYLLLLGALALTTSLAAGGLVYSIFNKTLALAAVETEDMLAFVGEVDPVAIDPAEELEKAKERAGGGGGGDGDENPAQRGAEATQTKNPLFSPSKDYVRVTNPEIKIRAATEGTKESRPTDEPYGLKNGGLIPSDGQGCCGGQGKGRGRGQGNDEGDGLGPGKNGGPGGGGKGPLGGRVEDEPDIPKVSKGVTEPVKLISRPRANYTDLARENTVQGKVLLKVTFLASGKIGNIVPVSGLPYGLTEQAIAAARAIRFEPAKVNGVAVSVTKTIEYIFTIF